MGNSKDTLFQSGGGAGQSASDYVSDVFEDVSLAPTNNSGFTSTASTNPLGEFLINSDNPKLEYRMLWVKRLIPLTDTSKWINNKPTFKIEFQETLPGVYGYAYGDIRLRSLQNDLVVSLGQIDDGIGICGPIRKLHFIVQPVADATANADILIDGSDTGVDVNFNSLPTATVASTVPGTTGFRRWHATVSSASNQTKDIHDYRLTANQLALTSVSGFAVYFENATNDIDLFPGSTYVDKIKQTTNTVTNQAMPTITSPIGGRTIVYKTGTNTYGQTTNNLPAVFTSATGSNGSALVTVTTGHGASFPAGTGLAAFQGTSPYVGSVVSVSTDTLTVSPVLPFALSGATMYSAWASGSTFAVSATLYQKAYNFDAGTALVPLLSGTSTQPSQNLDGAIQYSDSEKRYRFWGSNLRPQTQQGYWGVGFAGASGFMQFDFYGAALEVELASPGAIFHGTFTINGTPGWGINEGVTGIIKKTIISTGGPNWNSVVLYPGSSMSTAVVIQNWDVYYPTPVYGQTTGRLASFDTLTNKVTRTAQNASLMALGTYRRYYADDLYFTGGWLRGVTTNAAGGAFYIGSSTNSAFSFNYFGREFAIIGSAASMTLSFDGASIATQFNVGYSIGTLGFHSLTGTVAAGGQTAIIQAIDTFRARSGLRTEQNYLPRQELDDAIAIYQQSNTPRQPKAGDIWASNKSTNDIWIYLFDRWNKINISFSADDPNAPTVMARSNGSSTTAAAQANGIADIFNYVSWSTVTSNSATVWKLGSGNTGLGGFSHAVDGENTAGAVTSVSQRFNKASWAAFTARSTTKSQGFYAIFNNALLAGKGFVASAQTGMDSWNGTSWTNGAATFGTASIAPGAFVQAGLVRVIGGTNSGGTGLNLHETWDGSSVSSSTVVPTAGRYSGAQSGAGAVRGLVTAGYDGGALTVSYEWSGSWSSSVTIPATFNSNSDLITTGYFAAESAATITNYNTGSISANVFHFINTSYVAGVASSNAQLSGQAGMI